MLQWLRYLTTGKDNQSPDILRVMGALMGVQFIVNSGWSLAVSGQAWDPNAYGVGAAALLAALGIAMGVARKTEPSA